MKKHVIGVFSKRADAERAITDIHTGIGVPDEEISYIYRNTQVEIKEVEASRVSGTSPREGAATGAKAGAAIGALAGIAASVGVIPVVGSILAAGPLLAAVGIGGAVGATAAGALGGAAVGGIIGALVSWGVSTERAQRYQDQVLSGDILVAVHTEHDIDVSTAMIKNNAKDVETHAVTV